MIATTDLYPHEYDQLMRTGHLEIDHPERGHIEFWLLFDENKPGIEGKRLHLRVHRAGSAALKQNDR